MEYYMAQVIITKTKNGFKLCTRNYGKYAKITFNINNASIPFGIENYNNKDMINIELDITKNNDLYNAYSQISQFEAFIKDIIHKQTFYKLPAEFTKTIVDKQFISCVKTRNNNTFHIRTHLKKQGSVIKSLFLNKNNDYVNPFDISNLTASFIISADSIWINNESYGIVFLLDKCLVN